MRAFIRAFVALRMHAQVPNGFAVLFCLLVRTGAPLNCAVSFQLLRHVCTHMQAVCAMLHAKLFACGCCYAQAFTSPWPSPGLSLHQEQQRQLKAVAVDLTRTAAGHMDASGCSLGSSAHNCATTCETWVLSITVSTLCASTEQCHH